VRAGGVEQPPSIYIIVDEFCFLYVNHRHRAVPLPPPVSPLTYPEVDDDDATLDLDPTVAYRFDVLKRT
jgi:hypothetical protein